MARDGYTGRAAVVPGLMMQRLSSRPFPLLLMALLAISGRFPSQEIGALRPELSMMRVVRRQGACVWPRRMMSWLVHWHREWQENGESTIVNAH